MPSLERRIADLEQRLSPTADDDLAAKVARRLSLAAGDELAEVLAATIANVELRRILGDDTGDRPDGMLDALGLDAGADGEAVLSAAAKALRHDPAGFRERVLSADRHAREGAAGRFDPVAGQWVFRDCSWVTPEMWERTVEAVIPPRADRTHPPL